MTFTGQQQTYKATASDTNTQISSLEAAFLPLEAAFVT